MQLLIISHTPHYKRDGKLVAWGPTVREIDSLTHFFDQVIHIAPLHQEAAPESAIAYQSSHVRVRPVPPAGGSRLVDKLSIVAQVPVYVHAMLAEFGRADVIHVRCPANISLIATILLCIVHHPRSRWLKYAGNWQPEGEEPRSYTLQRWLLKGRLHGGIVTVNGEWPNQPGHIHHFHNPCLTDHELAEARVSSALKQLSNPIRLLFVGRLETAKGVGRALEIMAELKREGLSATLDLVGDGPERASFENQAKNLEIWHLVRFHGWLPRPLLGPLYAQSHVTLLPTKCSEGWPKILSEAMAYGVVPVSSNVSSIPQYLKIFETGLTFEADDVEGFAGAIALYCSRPERWKEESEKGVRAAHFFGYSHYLNAVRGLLALTTENNGGVSASPPPVDESRKHEAIVE